MKKSKLRWADIRRQLGRRRPEAEEKSAKLGTGSRRCVNCGVREDATSVCSKCCAATPANELHTFASGLLSNPVQYLRALMQSTQVRQKTFGLTPQEPEKGRTEIVAAVNTQPEPPHEKSNPWDPPRDVHDQAAWDRYWQHQGSRFDYCPAICNRLTERQREVQQLLAEGKSMKEIASVLNLTPRTVEFHKYRIMEALHPRGEDSLLIQCLIKRGAKTVLCAGNGVSQEPRALAAAGFDVTAMDLSPLAVHLAETWQFSSEELDSFCTKEQRTPGGTVRFVIGDVLDRSVCPGPFDAIIERRMLQLFPEQEQGVALDALASRLTAHGLLLSHRHNTMWIWPSNKPVGQFFHDRGWSCFGSSSSFKVPDHDGRVVWLILSSG